MPAHCTPPPPHLAPPNELINEIPLEHLCTRVSPVQFKPIMLPHWLFVLKY